MLALPLQSDTVSLGAAISIERRQPFFRVKDSFKVLQQVATNE